MATPLPVSFRISALPPNQAYTPQQFADAIAARLQLVTAENLSLFVSGSIAPTTDSGPWLKNGVTWYVWSADAGAYIPQIIDFESLRYVASQTAPDPNKYVFWIQVGDDGKAKSIQYYSGGSWLDIYADQFADHPTFAQMNSAIAAGQTTYPFRAEVSASSQNYTAGAGDTEVVFDQEVFDPSGVFNSNKFTATKDGYYTFRAAIYLSLNSGTPTGIDRQIKLAKNGTTFARSVVQSSDFTGGMTISIEASVQMAIGDQVNLLLYVVSTGASTWDVANDPTVSYFEGNRLTT